MGIIKTGTGWFKQFDGILNGDFDRFLDGLKDEAIGLGGTALRAFTGAEVDTDENMEQ